MKVLRYGLTRDWVLGLKAVLASGVCLDLGGALVKNNTGYDLRQLFIGSEGTLGVIVEVTLRLARPPADALVALCAAPDDAAVLALFARLRASDLTLSAFEFLDEGCVHHVLAHRNGAAPGSGTSTSTSTRRALGDLLGAATLADEIGDAVLAATPAQARGLWALREDISESLHRHTPHKADIALPVARVGEFLAAWRPAVAAGLPGIEALCFGHIGDGNLHLNLLRPEGLGLPEFLARVHGFDDQTYALVQAHGGSISAEHGVGLLKREHLHYTRTPEELAIFRGIKAALDPRGILNPGRLYPDL